MGDGWHQGTMGGGWWVWIVIGWSFLAVFVVLAVSWFCHDGEPHSEIGASNSAIDILKQRFAQGQISRRSTHAAWGLLKDQP